MSSAAHDQFDRILGPRRGGPDEPTTTPTASSTAPVDPSERTHEDIEALPIGGRVAHRQALGVHSETGADGVVYFYDEKGRLHRTDGPAVVHPDGKREWYCEGQRHRRQDDHRDAGPAVHGGPEKTTKRHSYVFGGVDNITEYWHKGQLHCEDGPAVFRPDGTREWYRHGKEHRINGPAYIGPQGEKGYYIAGTACSNWLGYRRERRRYLRRRRQLGLSRA